MWWEGAQEIPVPNPNQTKHVEAKLRTHDLALKSLTPPTTRPTNIKCLNCGRPGHLAPDCWSTRANKRPTVHAVDEESPTKKMKIDVHVLDEGTQFERTVEIQDFSDSSEDANYIDVVLLPETDQKSDILRVWTEINGRNVKKVKEQLKLGP